MADKPIVLLSLHNKKALGVGYLEKALKNAGYEVHLIFFKSFNSVNPSSATQTEISLLKNLIQEIDPGLIGVSVMSSLYLETVNAVNNMLRESFNIPIVWGGVFPTLFPERCLKEADYVIRGEGEKAIVHLVDALYNNKPLEDVQNLAFKKDGQVIINEVGPLCQNLDELGYPEIGGKNRYFIDGDKLHRGDPLLNSISYEMSASRGCPFMCSYCCTVSLRRVYKNQSRHYLRMRSVSSVMDELNEAKSRMKNLKVIRFWDEIFSSNEEWVAEFAERYKKEIGLPFEIWAHPLKVDKKLIQMLVDVGLYKVVMGIQSGSPRVRKEIFHRIEKQEDIINASRIFAECKVPQVIYDFILRHPFETEEDIRQSYELCTKLAPPFELQLHELQFFPGIDIVEMAIKMNIATREELDKVMYAPMKIQYRKYWGEKNKNPVMNFWYYLIYMTQFGVSRPIARYFAGRFERTGKTSGADFVYKMLKPLEKFRHYYKKAGLLFR